MDLKIDAFLKFCFFIETKIGPFVLGTVQISTAFFFFGWKLVLHFSLLGV